MAADAVVVSGRWVVMMVLMLQGCQGDGGAGSTRAPTAAAAMAPSPAAVVAVVADSDATRARQWAGVWLLSTMMDVVVVLFRRGS
jgi:hypothetical protein